MGLFDKLKGIKNAVQGQAQAQPPPQQPPPQQPYQQQQYQQQPPQYQQPYQQAPAPQPEYDMAGFDPDNDEEGFYYAVLHMESEGQFGGTDESRAEVMHRYGIRDRSHWQDVKAAVYHALAQRWGGHEVSQRESNWRQGQMQQHMQAQTQKAAAGGGFAPVEGISLEAWAAINAAIVGGGNGEDLVKGAGIDQARWQRVSAEWNARMARDTTFAIATAYGTAFQAASQGKYANYAREAAAARAANRDLQGQPPMSYEQYTEILYEQAYAAKQGKDPVAALKACGLTIVDWTDLGAYMGYLFNRDASRNWAWYQDIHQRVEAKFAAKYPGVKTDLDIAF